MTDRRSDPTSSRHRSGILLCGLPLLAAFAAQAAPSPEEALVGGIAGDFRQAPLRCEWIAGEFNAVERSLSLYREELASVYIAVDGRTIGDSAGGAILGVEFDTWRTGPTSMTVAVDASRLQSPDLLTPGRRIEAWFADRGGWPHPLFCGELAVLRTDAGARRIDLLAVTPRTGAEGRSDARYVDVTGAKILEQLADAADLALEIQDHRQRTVFPRLERKQLADWPFMREIARRCGYEIVLLPGGKLVVKESAFKPPALQSRQWTDVRLADIAAQIARNVGRTADVRLTAAYPRITITQSRPDEDFLTATMSGYGISAWYESGKLMLAEDGIWTGTDSSGATLLSALTTAPDELQSRISIMGSADGVRSFRRSRNHPLLRSNDPERIPAAQATLLVGRAMRAAEPPRFELAAYAATAAALEGALARLEKSEDLTPERRFLIGYARSHRPTLLHIYRRMPGGLQALEAIGR